MSSNDMSIEQSENPKQSPHPENATNQNDQNNTNSIKAVNLTKVNNETDTKQSSKDQSAHGNDTPIEKKTEDSMYIEVENEQTTNKNIGKKGNIEKLNENKNSDNWGDNNDWGNENSMMNNDTMPVDDEIRKDEGPIIQGKNTKETFSDFLCEKNNKMTWYNRDGRNNENDPYIKRDMEKLLKEHETLQTLKEDKTSEMESIEFKVFFVKLYTKEM